MTDTAKFEIVLKDKVSKPAEKASKSLGRFGKQAKNVNANFRSGSTGLTAFAAKLGLAAAGYMAVAAAARSAGALISRSMKTETTVSALDRLTHHGRRSFGEIRTLATDLGLDIDDTAKAYTNFLKLQFSEQEAQKFVKLGADMQALGTSADDVQGIFRAIGQIRSKGRLQAEEMLQLAERGVSQILIKKQIAKAMGIAESEVEKAQRSGQVTWDIAGPAIERALNKKLGQKQAGEAGRQFAETTMRGATNRMRQQAKGLWIDLGERAAPGLKRGLSGFSKGMSSLLATEDGQRAMKALGTFAEKAGQAFEVLGKWMPKAIEALASGFFDGFGRDAGSSATAVDNFAAILKAALPSLRMAGKALGLMARALKSLSDAASTLRDMWDGVFGSAGVLDHGIAAITGKQPEMVKSGKFLMEGFMQGISSVPLVGPVLRIVDSMKAAFSGPKGIDEGSPSKVFRHKGQMTGLGYMRGIEETMPTGDDIAPAPSMRSGIGSGAAQAMAKRAGASNSTSVGGVTINVSGGDNPQETAQATLAAFEANLGRIMTRYQTEAAA